MVRRARGDGRGSHTVTRPGRFTRRALLWWALWLLWCGMIFFVSADPVFTGESTGEAIQQVAPAPLAERPQLVDALNVVIRKSGHFLGFAILGALSWAALAHFPRPRRLGLWAWAVATLYAASDEWHQSLVPGRTGAFRDVVLDSVGAAVAILCVTLVFRRANRIE